MTIARSGGSHAIPTPALPVHLSDNPQRRRDFRHRTAKQIRPTIERRAGDLLVPTDDTDEYPHESLVRLIGKKYPQRLAALYREVLEKRPHIYSQSIAETIGEGSLPREAKEELFVRAAGSKSFAHRYYALWELKKLQSDRFVPLLIATIDTLPRTPTEAYWKCPEAWFASLVCQTDDRRGWQALERAARRADAGLRLELLNKMCESEPTPSQLRQHLAFLGAFLDDETMRDISVNSAMYSPLFTGRQFVQLEVRNFAAMKMAELIKSAVDPKPEWSAEEWARLRADMRLMLTR